MENTNEHRAATNAATSADGSVATRALESKGRRPIRGRLAVKQERDWDTVLGSGAPEARMRLCLILRQGASVE